MRRCRRVRPSDLCARVPNAETAFARRTTSSVTRLSVDAAASSASIAASRTNFRAERGGLHAVAISNDTVQVIASHAHPRRERGGRVLSNAPSVYYSLLCTNTQQLPVVALQRSRELSTRLTRLLLFRAAVPHSCLITLLFQLVVFTARHISGRHFAYYLGPSRSPSRLTSTARDSTRGRVPLAKALLLLPSPPSMSNRRLTNALDNVRVLSDGRMSPHMPHDSKCLRAWAHAHTCTQSMCRRTRRGRLCRRAVGPTYM